MNDQERGLFQNPQDDDGPRAPELIRGVPLQTLSKTIAKVAEVLSGIINVETPGGMVVIHELFPAKKDNFLRCWQFSFGKNDDHHIMECAEECTQGVSNFLDDDTRISSVQLDLAPGTISDPEKCKLALSAQGFEDPKANEALIVAIARYFQWIHNDFEAQISQLSDNSLIDDLLSLKFFS